MADANSTTSTRTSLNGAAAAMRLATFLRKVTADISVPRLELSAAINDGVVPDELQSADMLMNQKLFAAVRFNNHPLV